MKYNRIITLLITIIMSASLTACKNKLSPVTSSDMKNNEKLSGKIVVWSSNSRCKSLKLSAENFKKKYPKLKFEFVNLGNQQIYDNITTALISKTGIPDVVSIEGNYIPAFVDKFSKGFVDLTNEVSKNDFLPIKIAECTVKGKIMAFPWDIDTSVIFYRKDLFDKVGVKAEDIKTWDDYIQVGKKLNAIGIKMLPIDLQKNDVMYRQLINQLGIFYFGEDGKPLLNSDLSIKAMKLIKKMKDENIVYDNVDLDGIVRAAKNNKIASVPIGSWWSGILQNQCKDESGKWAVMRFPAFEAGGKRAAVLGGSNIIVTQDSQNKKIAIEFAKFAATDKESIIKGFKDFNLYPSYIPSYSEEIFEEKVEYFGGQKVWKLFTHIGKDIPNINFTENFAETKNNVIDAQFNIMFKGADVKMTMDELQKNVTEKFEK